MLSMLSAETPPPNRSRSLTGIQDLLRFCTEVGPQASLDSAAVQQYVECAVRDLALGSPREVEQARRYLQEVLQEVFGISLPTSLQHAAGSASVEANTPSRHEVQSTVLQPPAAMDSKVEGETEKCQSSLKLGGQSGDKSNNVSPNMQTLLNRLKQLDKRVQRVEQAAQSSLSEGQRAAQSRPRKQNRSPERRKAMDRSTQTMTDTTSSLQPGLANATQSSSSTFQSTVSLGFDTIASAALPADWGRLLPVWGVPAGFDTQPSLRQQSPAAHTGAMSLAELAQCNIAAGTQAQPACRQPSEELSRADQAEVQPHMQQEQWGDPNPKGSAENVLSNTAVAAAGNKAADIWSADSAYAQLTPGGADAGDVEFTVPMSPETTAKGANALVAAVLISPGRAPLFTASGDQDSENTLATADNQQATALAPGASQRRPSLKYFPRPEFGSGERRRHPRMGFGSKAWV